MTPLVVEGRLVLGSLLLQPVQSLVFKGKQASEMQQAAMFHVGK